MANNDSALRWLTTARALDHAQSALDVSADRAGEAMVKRLATGLIGSKCSQCITGTYAGNEWKTTTSTGSDLTAPVWQDAMNRPDVFDWSAGDVSFWITKDRTEFKVDLLGVQLNKDDVEREFHIEPRWISAREALEVVRQRTGAHSAAAVQAVLKFAEVRRLRARALDIREEAYIPGDRASAYKDNRIDDEVPPLFWEKLARPGQSNLNWETGLFAGKGAHRGQMVTMTLTGVEFDGDQIDDLFAPSEPQPVSELVPPPAAFDPPVQKDSGGRSRKAAFWDAVTIALVREAWLRGPGENKTRTSERVVEHLQRDLGFPDADVEDVRKLVARVHTDAFSWEPPGDWEK